MTEEKRTVRVLISGRVQGVWFRAWTCQEAQRRGLDGWVRNLHDGRVEAVFSGAAGLVDDMIRASHQGPPAAEVADVDVTEEGSAPDRGFFQRQTG